MNELKEQMEQVFSLARIQLVNANPQAENQLIALIQLKQQLFEELDKVPQDKSKK